MLSQPRHLSDGRSRGEAAIASGPNGREDSPRERSRCAPRPRIAGAYSSSQAARSRRLGRIAAIRRTCCMCAVVISADTQAFSQRRPSRTLQPTGRGRPPGRPQAGTSLDPVEGVLTASRCGGAVEQRHHPSPIARRSRFSTMSNSRRSTSMRRRQAAHSARSLTSRLWGGRPMRLSSNGAGAGTVRNVRDVLRLVLCTTSGDSGHRMWG